MGESGGRPAGVVIVPAHNEEAVIAQTLTALRPLVRDGIQIVVAANACSDQTLERVRRFPHVDVLELAEASKTAALNAADDRAGSWPRLYLDADIVITPAAVRDVFDALAVSGVLAARPTFRYATEGAVPLVQAYYRARNRIPATHEHLWGAGAYALSRAGHERLGRFPAVVADDLLVDRLFSPSEIRIVATDPVAVRCPRELRSLARTLRRVYAGRNELEPAGAASSAQGLRAVLATVRGPGSLVDAAVYAAVALAGKLLALRPGDVWLRDESNRRAAVPAGSRPPVEVSSA
jgi:glycosyltransferase involved in cell wall biosynthesis